VKRLIVILATVLFLAGCAGPSEAVWTGDGSGTERDFKLNDGRTLHCIWFGGYNGGPTCDWPRAK
jgi:hypothetical protein